MAIHSIVLEKPVGSNAEGSVIQCDEELAQNLIQAGVAREATEEDVSGAEGPDEETEAEDNPDEMTDAVRRLAASAEDTVTKAVAGVAEKLAKASVKAPELPGNRHVGGSDFALTGGFKNFGECTLAKYNAQFKGDWQAAKKFTKYAEMRTKATGMSIGGGSGHQGGDLVPQQWADDLWKLSFKNVPDLLSMMQRYEMRNQIENVPSWVQSAGAAGIQANVIAEASSITATVGVTANVQLELVKAAVLVNTSDELLRFNAYNLQNVIEQTVPPQIRFLTNGGVVNGTNSQIGLTSNAAAVTVIAESPGRINFNDVSKMDAALWDDFDEGAIWLCTKDTLPELYSLAYPNRSATTPIPAWTPGTFGQDNLLGPRSKGTLMGKPVYTVENCPALGSRGALILWHPGSCAYGTTGLIADSTKYLYFDLAQDSFRFMFYFDSVNPLTVPYSRASGGKASNIVVLSAGSTSAS
jgi:HK97 family phage major capsid protein